MWNTSSSGMYNMYGWRDIGIHEEIQTFPKKFDADMLKD